MCAVRPTIKQFGLLVSLAPRVEASSFGAPPTHTESLREVYPGLRESASRPMAGSRNLERVFLTDSVFASFLPSALDRKASSISNNRPAGRSVGGVCLACRRVVNERETMGVTKILADYSGFAAGKEGLWERREQSSVQAGERASMRITCPSS